MRFADALLPLLVAGSAVIYAIFVGRAQASRLRNLQADVSNGKLRGLLVIAIVIAMIVASLAFRG